MKKGDILELEITSSGMEGEGVARHDGVVVFVPRALVGEKVRVMVKEVRSRFARAGVIKLIEPSPHRVKPVCPVFYKCGSCDMQHIDYGEQLRVKRASVASCLAKACGREIDVDEVVPSPRSKRRSASSAASSSQAISPRGRTASCHSRTEAARCTTRICRGFWTSF